MGGKTSCRWPKGYKREPSVEETWVLDCNKLEHLFKSKRKSQVEKCLIERNIPPGSFPIDVLLKNGIIMFSFLKHGKRGKELVTQKIGIEAIDRKGFFAKQYFFICSHCGKHFRKLYMRDDERYNDDVFCCRKALCLTYASRLTHGQ